MTIAKKSALVLLITVLAGTSSFAIAQAQSNDDAEAPSVAEPAGEGDAAAGMRGPGRRADRMVRRLDTDGSGDISVEEFGERRLGWIIDADEDGDGVLSMEEITGAIEQRRQERREARLLRRFDIDGDGEVTVAELERQQEKRFALMDRDDDGVLSGEEMQRRGMGPRAGHGRMGGHHKGGMGWHHSR
ncbi:EF-hand domain-containing protein [Pararhizobium haloflavum]|uniref:EF-hand domain-containing protein n=1 Tax=Pararhizobium haloflavum TaxID=2037914 RepID=UPI000C1A13E3|nr:EF-hand domain-containing protein [Pararhizobium haloflavum]